MRPSLLSSFTHVLRCFLQELNSLSNQAFEVRTVLADSGALDMPGMVIASHWCILRCKRNCEMTEPVDSGSVTISPSHRPRDASDISPSQDKDARMVARDVMDITMDDEEAQPRARAASGSGSGSRPSAATDSRVSVELQMRSPTRRTKTPSKKKQSPGRKTHTSPGPRPPPRTSAQRTEKRT
jgi:hypothetical protein